MVTGLSGEQLVLDLCSLPVVTPQPEGDQLPKCFLYFDLINMQNICYVAYRQKLYYLPWLTHKLAPTRRISSTDGARESSGIDAPFRAAAKSEVRSCGNVVTPNDVG